LKVLNQGAWLRDVFTSKQGVEKAVTLATGFFWRHLISKFQRSCKWQKARVTVIDNTMHLTHPLHVFKRWQKIHGSKFCSGGCEV
jgi:hypothetical protein